MLIGITYNLKSYYLKKGLTQESVAEFDCEETIAALENAIIAAGHRAERIGCIEELMEQLMEGQRWDLVFNIAEGVNGIGREAQIPALLDAYKIPYTFSPTEVLATALDKGLTNAIMRTHHVTTAAFFVVRCENDIRKIRIKYPMFVKPVAEGTSRGITHNSKVTTKEDLQKQCMYILKNFHQPALVEEYLPGREFTVGLLGTGDQSKVLGVLEITPKGDADKAAYTYDNKQLYENRINYTLVDEPKVAKLARKAWRALNCRDAGRVDIRINSKGEPCFMEVNPLAGLNPTYSDLCILCRQIGFPYNELIKHIIDDAIARIK